MLRKLQSLLAAALALTALGAMASSAHAAEELFHCSVEPCRVRASTDGTGTTAHHVFIIENAAKTESASFTCESFRGEARSNTKTTSELTFAWPNTALRPNHDREAYDNCKVNGSPGVEFHMNGCEYVFHSAGGGTGTAKVDVICPEGQFIEFRLGASCVFKIGTNKGLTGIGYHTINEPPNREVTVTANVTVPNVVVGANCPIAAGTDTGTFSTGNTIVTTEEDNLTESQEVTEGKVPTMADGWWA